MRFKHLDPNNSASKLNFAWGSSSLKEKGKNAPKWHQATKKNGEKEYYKFQVVRCAFLI